MAVLAEDILRETASMPHLGQIFMAFALALALTLWFESRIGVAI